MGTIVVGGLLALVVLIIIGNLVRRFRRGQSVFCNSKTCDCGCKDWVQSLEPGKGQGKPPGRASCCQGHECCCQEKDSAS